MKNNLSIRMSRPAIDNREIKAVKRVLKSGNLAQGREVEEFEKSFSSFVGGRECIAVNSGTSALHLALLSLGIGPGDEVITPSFTFAATANAIALTGALPIFVDIDSLTFNIDPTLIEKSISSKTRAILVVHLFGLPANMSAISDIAKKYKLKIIEDAAQAHLAAIENTPVGTFGDAAAFSFYPTKNMTTGEGGMLVLKNSEEARIARLYRNQGMKERYKNEIVGFNYRMSELHAAIGNVQIKKIEQLTEIRIKNASLLNKKIGFFSVPQVPNGYKHVYHQYTIRIPEIRDFVAQELTSNGIENSIYYPTQVHKLQSFRSEINLPETQLATETLLSIPVHPSLSKKDLLIVAETVNRIAQTCE